MAVMGVKDKWQQWYVTVTRPPGSPLEQMAATKKKFYLNGYGNNTAIEV